MVRESIVLTETDGGLHNVDIGYVPGRIVVLAAANPDTRGLVCLWGIRIEYLTSDVPLPETPINSHQETHSVVFKKNCWDIVGGLVGRIMNAWRDSEAV